MKYLFDAVRYAHIRISKRRDTVFYSALIAIGCAAAASICPLLTVITAAASLTAGREFARFTAWMLGPYHQAPAGRPNTFPTPDQTCATLAITTLTAFVPLCTSANIWIWKGIEPVLAPVGFVASSACVAVEAQKTGSLVGRVKKSFSDFRVYYFDYYAKNSLDQGPGFFEALGDKAMRLDYFSKTSLHSSSPLTML